MKKIFLLLTFIVTLSLSLCLISIAADTNTIYTDSDGISWKVTLKEDMTAVINGVDALESRTSSFTIPSKITVDGNEYTVTVIGSNAFNGNTNVFGKLTLPTTLVEIKNGAFCGTYIYGDLTLPDSLKSIGDGAFKDCSGITSVTLPESITKIPSNLFNGCSSLVSVKAKGTIVSYGNNCFQYCYALSDITISEQTTTIGGNAFNRCYALKGHINIPNATLGGNAFYECKNITEVTLGTKADVSSTTFRGCTSLTQINIASGNSKYVSIDGIVFSKDGKTLIQFPLGRESDEYTIPEKVETIGDFAFAYSKVKKIFVSNVTTINQYAFSGSKIETFYAPDTVTFIGQHAFSNTEDLDWIVLGNGITRLENLTNSSINILIAKNDSFTASNVKTYMLAKNHKRPDHYYGYIDLPADCENDGYKTCVLCGKTEQIEKFGHSGRIIERSSLSCITDEYEVIDCKRCGHTVKITSAISHGHDKQPLDAELPTGLNIKLYKCKNCLEIFYENFEANAYKTGDIDGNGIIDEKDVALLGSYIAGGSYSLNFYSCDVNGDGKVDILDLLLLRKYVADPSSAVLSSSDRVCTDHIRLSSVPLTRSTCTTCGLELVFCLDCGTVIKTAPTPYAEHDFEVVDKINPTCKSEGSENLRCRECGLKKYQTLEKLSHTQNWIVLEERGIEYNTCTICGEFESRKVDYSVLDELIRYISPYYKTYYTNETAIAVKPILENYKNPLTQKMVDKLVDDIIELLPTIKYNTSTVPVIYLETDDSLSKGMDYVAAKIAISYTDEDGVVHFINEYDGKMRVRGNSTANATKFPFNIKFSKSLDIFGMGKGKKYCLIANLYDKTLIRNALAFELGYSMGLDYTPKYEFVEVYVNGVYNGSYIITTPVDVGSDRVDIDENNDFLLETEAPRNTNEQNGYYVTTPIFKIRALIDSPDTLSSEAYSKLYTTLYQIDFAILSGDWNEICKYIDVESMAKYFVYNEYLKNLDIIWDSTRFYIRDGKLYGGPAWDYDLSMGNVKKTEKLEGNDSSYTAYWNYTGLGNGTPGDSTTGTWADIGWLTSARSDADYRIWFYALCKYSPEFNELIKQTILKYNDSFVGMYEDMYDEYGDLVSVSLINKILENENIKLSIDNNYTVFGISGVNYTDMWYVENMYSYNDSVEYLTNWLEGRYEWMMSHYFPDGETTAQSKTNQ